MTHNRVIWLLDNEQSADRGRGKNVLGSDTCAMRLGANGREATLESVIHFEPDKSRQ